MKNTKLNKVAAALAATLAAGAAFAAQTDSGTGTLAVNATISAQCAVGQHTAIDFGTLAMLSGTGQNTSDSTGAGAIDAICTNGAPTPQFRYSSANTSGTDFRLVGADATTYIGYSLYQSADSTTAPVTYNTDAAHPAFTATGASEVLDMSARILAADRNGKPMQTYSDTITITTSFGA